MTHDPKHSSRTITDGPDRAPARAMYAAVGFSREDLAKPLVGIANTWTEIGPCNYHLRRLAEWMQGREEVHIKGPGTDVKLNVSDRKFIPCVGEHNMPDG